MDAVRLKVRERAADFVERLKRNPPLRIPGTAVVLGRMTRKGVPLTALSHNVKCNRILHENVLLVAVSTAGDAEGVGRGPSRGRADRRRRHPRRAALRLHGATQCTRGTPRSRWPAAKSANSTPRRQSASPVTRRSSPRGGAKGWPAMARSAVRVHASQRPAARRLFQDPRRPNHGDRRRIRRFKEVGGQGTKSPARCVERISIRGFFPRDLVASTAKEPGCINA